MALRISLVAVVAAATLAGGAAAYAGQARSGSQRGQKCECGAGESPRVTPQPQARGGSGEGATGRINRRTVVLGGQDLCPEGSAYGGMTSGSSPGTILPGGGTAFGGSHSTEWAGQAGRFPSTPDVVCPPGFAGPGFGFGGLTGGTTSGGLGGTGTLP